MVALEINWDDINIERLQESDDLTAFKCDLDDDLGCDQFIHDEKEAKLYQKERHGITYLFRAGSEILGFVTVAMANIPAKSVGGKDRRRFPHPVFPSLLIGRLAVGNNRRKQQVGSHLIKWCVGMASIMSEKIGCRYVIVQTTKGGREEFYLKCAFLKAKEQDKPENTDGHEVQRVWLYHRIALD